MIIRLYKGGTMTESKNVSTKKTTNPLIFVGIGCLVLLVILGVVTSIAMKFFAKKIGTGIVQNMIESKTGVKTNISDLEKGKMSFTDEKTGTSIDIGSNKIPESFPKDFPIYPGMKLISTMSGSEKSKGLGYWLTFTTSDESTKVQAYYKTSLSSSGWKETATYSAGDTSTTTISKGSMSGTVSVSRPDSSKETTVIVMLGDDASSVTEQTEE